MSALASKTSSRPLALVTGASGGIGLHIATELAALGHDLVLVARGQRALDELAQALSQRHGIQAHVRALDLSLPDAADQLTAWLQAQALPVDVLVNNAGFGLYGPHAQADLAEEQQMIQVNITTLTRLTKLLLPGMLSRRRGQVMNVASTASFQPGPYMAVYYATKAYVLSYSEALAEELRGTGVTVTALCPGPTTSGFQDKAAMHDSALVKGRRLPTSAEVAAYGVKAMRRGQRVAIHGCMNWLMAQSVRFTPRALVTRVVALMSRPV